MKLVTVSQHLRQFKIELPDYLSLLLDIDAGQSILDNLSQIDVGNGECAQAGKGQEISNYLVGVINFFFDNA